MRKFYRDEENPYDYKTDAVATIYRDEEKEPLAMFAMTVMDEPSRNKINWDGSKQTVVGNLDRSQVNGAVASNNLKLSADETRNSTVNPTKLKEIRIPYGGTIKTSFLGEDISAGFGGNVRVYVNGTATGTNHAMSTTEAEYTDTISLNASDLVQLYALPGGGGNMQVRNFQISFDRTIDGDGTILTN